MCGLFGFSQYGEEGLKNISLLTEALAEESVARGADATGIAFCKKGRIEIHKDSKPAYGMKLSHPENIKALMGHTRHTTHGSEKLNFNNHPFGGRTKNTFFALAHNGILSNCRQLSGIHNLPATHIETDSYTAVQLLEKKKHLDFDSIKFMAEAVEGSFCFSILDNKNNLYLVKGDNPLHMLHFPAQKIYVYASTEEILWKALVSSLLFDSLKAGDYEVINMTEGDIIKISDGKIETDKFEYKHPLIMPPYCSWYDGWYDDYGASYTEELKSIAGSMGHTSDFVDEMLKQGFTFDDIEDYLYCGEGI